MSLALVAVSAKYWRANDSGPHGVGHCDCNTKARDTPPREHEILHVFFHAGAFKQHVRRNTCALVSLSAVKETHMGLLVEPSRP